MAAGGGGGHDTSPNFDTYQDVMRGMAGARIERVRIDSSAGGIRSPYGRFSFGAPCELEGPAGALIDRRGAGDEFDGFPVWRLLGRTVARVEFPAGSLPTVLVTTEDGYRLSVSADDDGLEDWEFQTADRSDFIVCNGDDVSWFSPRFARHPGT